MISGDSAANTQGEMKSFLQVIYCAIKTLRHSHQFLLINVIFLLQLYETSGDGFSAPLPTFTAPFRPRLKGHGNPIFHLQSSTKRLMAKEMYKQDIEEVQFMNEMKSPSNPLTQFHEKGVLMGIERTSQNSRRIMGRMQSDIPINDLFTVLTDYDSMAGLVPTLIESKVTSSDNNSGKKSVYHRHKIPIVGAEFGLNMDCMHRVHQRDEDGGHVNKYKIDFACVESSMLSQMDGSWVLESSNSETAFSYIVDITPRGPVLDMIDWLVRENVPSLLLSASKTARERSEKRRDTAFSAHTQASGVVPPVQPQKQMSRGRNTQSPMQQLNLIDELVHQVENNMKQTAKQVLPPPVVSLGRSVMKAMNNANSMPATSLVASSKFSNGRRSSMNAGKSNSSAGAERGRAKGYARSSVSWQQDETLAMYLKD